MSLRKIIVILVLLFAAGGGVYFLKFRTPAGMGHGMPPDMMGAAPVGVAEVIVRDVNAWNEFSGRLTAVDQVEIRPRVSGTVEQIHFADGATVAKGDLLFTIDQKPYQAALKQAEGALASAQAQANLARTQYKRSQNLIGEKVITQRSFDESKSAVGVAEANLKGALAALDVAKLNLDYTLVKSPIAGKIGRAEITAGNLVETAMGAPMLTTVVSLSPIYADFEMDEESFLKFVQTSAADVTKIPAQLVMGDDVKPHVGHIQSFDNKLNAATGTIRVRAVFDNEGGSLVPGLFARVRMGSAAQTKSVLITDRAVGTDQDKKFVMVVGTDNKVQYRPVTLGATIDGLRIVENGLAAGEKIVVNGLQRARPGSEIAPEIVPMDAPPPAPMQAPQ
jgi:multidrug efflux system membrane fusion protein